MIFVIAQKAALVFKRAHGGPGSPWAVAIPLTFAPSVMALEKRSHGRTAQKASLIVFAIWLAALSRWWWSDGVVPWDSKNQFFAFQRFLADTLARGESPFWNPFHYAGHPSIADPQSLIFSPVFFLWAWLDAEPSMRVFDVIVYAHLLAGGVAVILLGSRRDWPVPAMVLAAVVFMLGGAASGRLNHTGIITVYAALPVALILLEWLLARPRWITALAFGMVAAFIVVGRNQVALMIALVVAGLTAQRLVADFTTRSQLRRQISMLALAGLVAIALAGLPVLLTLQFADLSNRPEATLTSALAGSLHPVNLVSLASPNPLGSHDPDHAFWGPNPQLLPETAAMDDSFSYLFIGAVPALLLVWLGLCGGRMWERGSRGWSGVLLLALAFSLGRYTPFFAAVFKWLPGFGFFRRPADALFVLGAMAALVTGHLVAGYIRHGLPRVRPFVAACLMAGIALLAAAAISFSAKTGHGSDAAVALACTAALAAIAAAFLALAKTGNGRHRGAVAVVAIAVVELLAWNAGSTLNAEDRSNYAVLERSGGRADSILARLAAAIDKDRAAGMRPRVEVLGIGGAWQNVAMTLRMEAINGYNPLRIGAYDRLVAPGEENWYAPDRAFPTTFPGYDSALARRLGLTYLLLDRPIEKLKALRPATAARILINGPDVWAYRLEGGLARAVLVDGKGGQAPAEIITWESGRVILRVDARTPGTLVLHDLYYPGWIAHIDGKPAAIRPYETLFRAIEVPMGRHDVSFIFAPLRWDNLVSAARALLD